MLKRLICNLFSHDLAKSNARCPFTQKTYDYCRRCNKMIAIEDK